MKPTRKTRTDSVENLRRIATSSDAEPAPPPHVPLSDRDWPYWHSVVAEFAGADWTDHGLEIAALLSRTMAQLESEQRAQRFEGMVIPRSNGFSGPNPRNRTVSQLTGQVLSYRRSLGLTARAKAGGRSEEAARRRKANRDLERRFRGTDDDGLLAS